MTTSVTPHTGAASDGENAYRRLVEEHRWTVPDRYNMAADVADRHPGDRLALVFEDHTGHREEVVWQQIQDRSQQVAAHLHALGVRKETGSPCCSRSAPTPRRRTSASCAPAPSW